MKSSGFPLNPRHFVVPHLERIMDVYQCTQSLDSKILKYLFRFEREFEFDDNSMIDSRIR